MRILALGPESHGGVAGMAQGTRDYLGALLAAEEVEAIHLGEFTDSGELVVRWGSEEVGRLDLGFLHDGLPKQERKAEWRAAGQAPCTWPADTSTAGDLLKAVLATPTVCSKEWILRQYDHEVQGASALKPLVGARAEGPGDAAAVAPVPGSPRGVLVGLRVEPALHVVGTRPLCRQAMPPLRSSKRQSSSPAWRMRSASASGRSQASTVSGR